MVIVEACSGLRQRVSFNFQLSYARNFTVLSSAWVSAPLSPLPHKDDPPVMLQPLKSASTNKQMSAQAQTRIGLLLFAKVKINIYLGLLNHYGDEVLPRLDEKWGKIDEQHCRFMAREYLQHPPR